MRTTNPLLGCLLLHALSAGQLLVPLSLPLVQSRGKDSPDDVAVLHNQDVGHVWEESRLSQEGGFVGGARKPFQDETRRPGEQRRMAGVDGQMEGGERLMNWWAIIMTCTCKHAHTHACTHTYMNGNGHVWRKI